MTITKTFSQFGNTFVDYSKAFSDKAISFTLRNARKLSAISLSARMVIVVSFLAILPMGTMKTEAKTYQTNVTFNKNSAFTLEGQKKVNIEVGESEADRIAREANAKNATKTVVAAKTYSDPSDFRAIYMAAGARFGIPWQLIEAVHEVESGKSGSTTTRSYAGAQGPMQFMPGTWRAYGVDGDGDGTADANNVVDAIYGGANLLASSGAAEGDFQSALFNYNHAQWYVTKVITIAYEIGLPR